MTARGNGITSASKPILRNWRDVRNGRRVFCVSGRQERLPAYLPSTCNSLVQKRWMSAGKALVYEGKRRIHSSNVPATAATGPRKASALLLRTLNQTQLNAEDFASLAGRVCKTVRSALVPEELGLPMYYLEGSHTRGRKDIPFPPESHGFLYWHLQPDAPPVTGQVRFRITKSSDPATFPSGHDLQLPDGRIWHISLFDIARRQGYSGLRAHLMSEKLITAKMLNNAMKRSASSQDKHRIAKYNITPTIANGLRKGPALRLHTLNQERLQLEDFVDLTGRGDRTLRFPLAPELPRFRMRYFESDGRRIPFPPDSHGFLYWHIESDAQPAEGQVRFRITKSSDPATFRSGRDLQLPDGRIWHIPFFRIAHASEYSGLRAHLLSEKLVTAQVLKTALNGSPSSQDAHRIPKSDIPSTAATGLRHGSALRLCTLNRTRLDVKDFVDLTGRLTKTVHFPAAHEESSFQMRYYGQGVPFPPESHGFFYWHLDPDAPPVSGQVRFRTTASSDPATFPIGRDLQLPDGRIWHISLFDIARRATYSGLRAHLLSEKLVTVKLLDSASSITAARGEKVGHPATGSLLIWKFGQRFLVDFPGIKTAIWILGSSTAERLLLPPLFSVHVRESESAGICYVLSERSKSSVSGQTGRHDFLNGVEYTPFAGRALVQFERSTLPGHKGTRTVVLRILKVMKRSDGSDHASWTPEPQEDGLDMTGMHQHAWSVNVDQPQRGHKSPGLSAKALRILFDNEALQERQGRRRPKSCA
ncbi:hypothetical protein OE88DRAFT_1669401 [Heliocybe sulcata]|uniref:Uncharacterized protein n=1 Tax=Heliocybe sulcata TaxID=5364 RepID=A0A5C3MJ47_9AGAM|nr:hypothetical protein OE88DRAFT_1669401 [Heliocybe sulcata]